MPPPCSRTSTTSPALRSSPRPSRGALQVSTVNIAEALSSEAKRGTNPVELAKELSSRGLLDGAVAVYPFTTADAIEAARLRPLTHAAGLSLGDRACIALARRLDGLAITADTAWARVELDVELTLIREEANNIFPSSDRSV